MGADDRTERASIIRRFAAQLKYPQLFFLVAALFVVDLVIPDPLPFVDEMMLGLLTVLLGSWKARRDEPKIKDVTPKA